ELNKYAISNPRLFRYDQRSPNDAATNPQTTSKPFAAMAAVDRVSFAEKDKPRKATNAATHASTPPLLPDNSMVTRRTTAIAAYKERFRSLRRRRYTQPTIPNAMALT